MAFDNSQAFMVESKKLVGTEQFESTCRLDVQAEKAIKKVISVSALPKITSSEKVGDNIDFSGRTSYQVVYESEEGGLASVVAAIEWQNKTSMVYDNYYLCPTITENTVTGFSSNEIAISSLVNIDMYSVLQDKIMPVSNLSPDYVLAEKTYEYQKLINTVTENFNEVAEHEYNGKLEEVLYYSGDVRLKNAVAGIDSITLEGEINISVHALDAGRIVSINKVVDFKQEMASLSVVPNNLVDATVRLNDLKVTASVNETDNKTNLIMSIELGVYALVFNKESMTIVQDAFSLQNQTNSNYECVNVESFEGQGAILDTVTGTFETEKDIYELCFINRAEAVVSEINTSEQGVNIVGAIEIDAVCETETREKIKVQGVVPFNIETSEINKEDKIDIEARITASKLRGQREIENIIELCVNYKKQASEYISYLSQIEEIGEAKENLSAIRVYVVKEDEDLFSVSKALSVRPELIVSQNPEVAESLIAGTRLVIYSKLDINF